MSEPSMRRLRSVSGGSSFRSSHLVMSFVGSRAPGWLKRKVRLVAASGGLGFDALALDMPSDEPAELSLDLELDMPSEGDTAPELYRP